MVVVRNSNQRAEEPDPADLVRKAIAADLDPSVFTEQQFDVANNSIEWCTSHLYLNASDPLYPRQLQMLARFFEDACYFCSDVDYYYNVPVDDSVQNFHDRIVLLEHGVCPRCKRNRTEILTDWQRDARYAKYYAWDESVTLRPAPPNEFNGIWGQRASKSFSVATFFWPYILHRYLAIPSITNYFQLASNTVLEAAFVAPIKDQINTYMWTPFKHAFDASPWFRQYVDHLKAEEKRLGVEMYMRQQTYIGFPAKRMVLTMKAANSGTLRGGTRFFATLDEWGHFNVTEDGKQRTGVKDGTEVFVSMNRSLRTVRTRANKRRRQYGDYDALDGYMFCISSPSSISDPIELRAALANKSPRMMHTRYATWEVNPNEDEETLVEEEGADLIKFNRDYRAQPPRAASHFIEPGAYLKELVDHELTKRPLLQYEIKAVADKETGVTLLRPVLGRKAADKSTPRCLAVDNGEKNNSFALCLASYYPEHDGVLLEEFLEVAPYKHHQVDLQWCYDELIVPIIRTFNIQHVVYDRWESSYAVRDLRTNYRVDASQCTLRWKDFEDYRNDIKASRIWFPVPEVDPDELLFTTNLVERARHPRAHFQLQLTTVNQFFRKVVKPDAGNDDLFRCSVLAHRTVQGNKEKYRRGARSRVGGPKRTNVISTAGRMGGGYRPKRRMRY
jgi:hypothetical protein